MVLGGGGKSNILTEQRLTTTAVKAMATQLRVVSSHAVTNLKTLDVLCDIFLLFSIARITWGVRVDEQTFPLAAITPTVS